MVMKKTQERQKILNYLELRPYNAYSIIDAYISDGLSKKPTTNKLTYFFPRHKDIQELSYGSNISDRTYGLRSKILETWDNEDYINLSQKEYLIVKFKHKNFINDREKTFLEELINIHNIEI
tara:strand:- start:256 stop:621 length:366 start_codon:yes stop_codon:yes gene_type:complete